RLPAGHRCRNTATPHRIYASPTPGVSTQPACTLGPGGGYWRPVAESPIRGSTSAPSVGDVAPWELWSDRTSDPPGALAQGDPQYAEARQQTAEPRSNDRERG